MIFLPDFYYVCGHWFWFWGSAQGCYREFKWAPFQDVCFTHSSRPGECLARFNLICMIRYRSGLKSRHFISFAVCLSYWPEQNGHHFANISKCIFLMKKFHWSLCIMVLLIISQYGFRWLLGVWQYKPSSGPTLIHFIGTYMYAMSWFSNHYGCYCLLAIQIPSQLLKMLDLYMSYMCIGLYIDEPAALSSTINLKTAVRWLSSFQFGFRLYS